MYIRSRAGTVIYDKAVSFIRAKAPFQGIKADNTLPQSNFKDHHDFRSAVSNHGLYNPE